MAGKMRTTYFPAKIRSHLQLKKFLLVEEEVVVAALRLEVVPNNVVEVSRMEVKGAHHVAAVHLPTEGVGTLREQAVVEDERRPHRTVTYGCISYSIFETRSYYLLVFSSSPRSAARKTLKHSRTLITAQLQKRVRST